MKKIIFFSALFFLVNAATAQHFDDYFETKRLRIDFVFAGNATTQHVYYAAMHEEPIWGGTREHLIAPFNYGEYQLKVYAKNGKLIYTQGFSTLFQEWRTTGEAKKVDRAYPVSLHIPFPKDEMKIEIHEREKATGKFACLFNMQVDPQSKHITRDAPNNFAVTQILNNGEPSGKLDLVFVAEGYRAGEMEKFRADAKRMADNLFTFEPYTSRKNDINIWAVESVSAESGPDFPHKDSWKSTAFDAAYYTFDIDRYLTTGEQTKVAEAVWNTPADAVFILVNSSQYGGGGIYNFYGMGTVDNELSATVFVHEFGHSFAGLGDEYYTSDVAYEDFYNLKVEPWEPNITTNVNFESKWKNMIKPGTPVPTANEEKYDGVVGLFEGGGYMAKGIYRPVYNCFMKSNSAKAFCPVCQKAISDALDYYCK